MASSVARPLARPKGSRYGWQLRHRRGERARPRPSEHLHGPEKVCTDRMPAGARRRGPMSSWRLSHFACTRPTRRTPTSRCMRWGRFSAIRSARARPTGVSSAPLPFGASDSAYFFLHDGRTDDLLQAIPAHAGNGSEANAVIGAFFGEPPLRDTSYLALARHRGVNHLRDRERPYAPDS
jgi:hypothetical protein